MADANSHAIRSASARRYQKRRRLQKSVFHARGVCRASRMTDDDVSTLSRLQFRSCCRRDEKKRYRPVGRLHEERRRPGSHGRQSPIKSDFEPGPGTVSWSNHKSIYLPSRAGTIKNFATEIHPLDVHDTAGASLLSRRSRVLKTDSIACAIALIISEGYN